MTNRFARPALLALLALVCAAAAPVAAQESPAQWMARIFDPATFGIAPFPPAALNRKLSVDLIILERGGTKQIAIYIMPLDQAKPAADHFAKQFGVAPQIMNPDSPFETYIFDFTTDAKAAPKLAGLRTLISKSQWVDNKSQIMMEYTPPAAPPAAEPPAPPK